MSCRVNKNFLSSRYINQIKNECFIEGRENQYGPTQKLRAYGETANAMYIPFAYAKTKFEEIVLLWCILYYVPLKQFKRGQIHLAFYEGFCEEPEKEIKRLFNFLDKKIDGNIFKKLDTPSSVSRNRSPIVTGGSLIDGWRKDISEENLKTAVNIMKIFGLDNIYSYKSMPNIQAAYEMLDHP